MNEKIEDFKFSNWEDYAKTLKAENEKLRELISIYQENSILDMPRIVNKRFDTLIKKLGLEF